MIPPAAPRVLVPAGAPLMDAAAWIGRSCWLELHAHRVLTEWLGDEEDPELVAALWRIRAQRRELATAWHDRLPELRELPRSGFVEPDPAVEALVGSLVGCSTSPARCRALHTTLDQIGERYRDHRGHAVGPADGPAARTLAQAMRVSAENLDLLAQVPLTRT